LSVPVFSRVRHSLPIAAVLGALLVLALAGSAHARSYSVAPESAERGALVFRISGVPAARVSAAQLRIGRIQRRLRVGTVRAAARRGVLKIRARTRGRRVRLILRTSDLRPPRRPRPAPNGGSSSPPRHEAPAAPSGGDQKGTPAPQPPAGGVPTSPPGPVLPPAGARYVSPSGSDDAAGTEASPWRTLSKAISAAVPGDTVVLREGTYGAPGTRTNIEKSGTEGAPITFTGFPGEARPTVKGYVRVVGSHLRFSGITFDGPTGQVGARTDSNPGGEDVVVAIMYGSDVELSGSEVRNGHWHAGIYVYATDVRLVGNWVHDNGDRSQSSQANLDHGIYWEKGSGLVADNVVEHNYAYGVHLHPDAGPITVTGNTIVGNGRGGVLVTENSANNRIVGNVVADNAWYGIRAWSLTGSGNVAENNVLWHNSEDFSGDGFTLRSNVVADPRFVGAGDYHLQGSSPAIDRGLSGVGPAFDFEGVSRSRGAAPDAGAYEVG
jgi:copper-binding protein NosD